MSATLVAGLEMAKDGRLSLRQDEKFGPILVRNRSEGERGDE